MLLVQRPSLPHHIPFIEVVGLSWPRSHLAQTLPETQSEAAIFSCN